MAMLKQEMQDISSIPHTLQTPYVSQSSPKVFMFTDTVARPEIGNKTQVLLNEDPDSAESEQGNSGSDTSLNIKNMQDQDGTNESNQGTKMYSTIVLATSNAGFNNTFLNGEILNKPLVGIGSNCIIKYEDDLSYFEDNKPGDTKKKWCESSKSERISKETKLETVKSNALSEVISDWALCGCSDKRSDRMPVLMNLIGSSSIIDGSGSIVSSDVNSIKIKDELNDSKAASDKYSSSAVISPSFSKGTTSQSTVLQYLGSPNSTATLTYHHDGLLQDASGSSGVSILLTASDIGVLGAANPAVSSAKEVLNNSDPDLPLSPQSYSNSGVIVPNSCTYMFGIDSDSENVEKAVDPNKLCVKKPRPKTTSPSRQGPQTCPTCNKVFSNASALTKHKLTHSDERKYVCPTCGKAFKRQDHLNGHMLTHRNKKPYECKAEGCGKSYCDARSLRRHTENHHNGSVNSVGTSGSDDNCKVDELNGSQDSDCHGHMNSNNISVTTAGGHLQQLLSTPPLVNSQSPNVVVGNWKPISGRDKSSGKHLYKNSHKNSKITNQKKMNQKSTNDELTDEQLALIQQIMQQTREAAEAMQQKQSKPVPSKSKSSRTQTKSNNLQYSSGENGSKIVESKPVECSICERKFKNVPALNGHMRLHGGYFKKVGKNMEDKKSDKKDNGSAPLQTASSTIRALIEEKIIQKRISSNNVSGSTNTSFLGNMDRSKLSSASTPDSVISLPSGPPPPYPGTSILVTSTQSVVTKSVDASSLYSPDVSDKVSYTSALDHSPSIESDSFLNVKQEDNFDTHSVLNELLKGRSSSTSSRRDLSSELDDLEVLGLSASPDDSMIMLGDLNLNGSDDVLNMKSSLVGSSQSSGFNVDTFGGQTYSLQEAGGGQFSQGSSGGGDNFYADQLHSDYVPILDQETLQGLSGVDDSAFSSVFQDAKELNFPGDPLEEVSDYQSQEHIRDLIQAAKELQKLEESQSQSEVLHDIQADSLHDLGYADNQSLQELSAATIQENLLQTQSQTSFQSPLQSPIDKNLPLSHYNYSSIHSLANQLDAQVTHSSGSCQTNVKEEVSNSFQYHDQHRLQLVSVSTTLPCNSIHRSHSMTSHSLGDLSPTLLQSSSLSATKLTLNSEGSRFSVDKSDILPKMGQVTEDSNLKESSPIKSVGYMSPQSALAAAKTHIANFIKERNKLANAQLLAKAEQKESSVTRSQTPSDSSFDYSYIMSHCGSPQNAKRTKSRISVSIDSLKDDGDDDVFLSPTSLPSSPVKFGKKPRPAPLFIPPQAHSGYNGTAFQSRLRIPKLYDPMETRLFPFTPPPMLSPMRCGTGLFWQVLTSCPSSKVNSSCKGYKFGLEGHDNVSERPPETDIQPHVNVGPQHQCEIPSYIGGKCMDADKDSLVWHPDVARNCSQKEVNNYLEFSCSAAVPDGGRNVEYALHLLHLYQGDIQAAMLELMSGPFMPHSLRGVNHFESDYWKPEEIDSFQQALSKHDKDFHLIAQELKSKTVEQCVQFYYLWKKICLEESKCLRLQRRKREADHLCNLRFRMAALGVDGDLLQSTPKSDDMPLTPGTLENMSCLEGRPYNCEYPDCNAYFQSKQALLSHGRVHKSSWFPVHRSSSPGSASVTSTEGIDEYPCKVCGKIFSKVKSRSAHMKTHRPADAESRRSRAASMELNMNKSDSVPSTPTTPVTTDLQVKTLDTKALISQKTLDLLSLGQESIVTMNFSQCSN